jgi:hypothetical protein
MGARLGDPGSHPPGLYLREYHYLFVARDQVDLSVAAARIAGKHPETELVEVSCGQFLAESPKRATPRVRAVGGGASP